MLEIIETERPVPGPGEVLVRVRAAGVNPAEWKIRSGAIPIFGEPPFTLGAEFSGEIEALGAEVDGFSVGDEAYGISLQPNGAYADYIAIAAANIAPKPAVIDHIHAAALPVAVMTAWQGLVDVAGVKNGDRVLIHAAAGGVGHIAVQIAKSRGAHVVGTARASKHEFLRGLGADELIDYPNVDFTTAVSDVDVVFDLIGGEYGPRSLRVLRPGGLLIGATAPDFGLTPEDVEAAGRRFAAFQVSPSGEGLAALADRISDGLRVEIEQVLPLEQATKAHEISETGRVRGKLILTP